MDLKRLKADAKYILINRIIIYIPCWHIRKFIFQKLGMDIGANSRIAIGTVIIQPESIIIGNRTIINENCYLDGRGGLKIGNDVSVSIYTKIITASHKSTSAEFQYYEGKVEIEDNVWTGCGAIILDSSIIRKWSIIGAGCVFKGETQIKDIIVGNPAKKIKERNITNKYRLNYKPYFR